MAAEPTDSILDRYAGQLESVAKRAKAAATDAALAGELTTMADTAQTASPPIAEALSVLYDCPNIQLVPDEVDELARRRSRLREQIVLVLQQYHDDPTKIRRGTLWTSTKRSIDSVLEEAGRLRREHYRALLVTYTDQDADHLRQLPPHTPGREEYERAIGRFDEVLGQLPRSPSDVDRAMEAGHLLREARAQIESATVPTEFRGHWRQLRSAGLPLSDLTPEFHTWLRERGIEAEAVLRLRG